MTRSFVILGLALGASASACSSDGGSAPPPTADAGADAGGTLAGSGDDGTSDPGVVATDLGPVVGHPGRFSAVDSFLAGFDADDSTLFTRQKTITNDTEYRAAVAAITPDHANDVLSVYPATGGAYASAKAAYDAFITDLTFVCPTRKKLVSLAARGVATYLHRFEKLTLFGRASGLGVHHAAELPFVFGNLSDASGVNDAAKALAASMGGYWTRFAATGDPNGANATSWPRFDVQGDAYLRIDDTSQAGTGWHAAECAAMTGWFAAPP